MSLSTAKRALALARDWGLLNRDGPGRLVVATRPDVPLAADLAPPGSVDGASNPDGEILLAFTIRHRGDVVARFSSVGDPQSASELQQILLDAILRRGCDVGTLDEYEMDVCRSGESQPMMTFVARRRAHDVP